MGIWPVGIAVLMTAVGQVGQAPPAAPSETTVPVEAGKTIKLNVASPPYGNRPKEWPLLRIGSAKYEHAESQPATVTLNGSIQTAAKVDYRITVTLLAEGGKEVAATSTVEHVEHIEVGRVVTVLRMWKLDFGKRGAFDSVRAVRIGVLQLGAPPTALSPQEAVDGHANGTATVEMVVVRTGWLDGLVRPGADALGPVLVDPDLRLRDGARFQAVVTGKAIREWAVARHVSAPSENQLDQGLKGHRVRLTGPLQRDLGGAAGPAPWLLVVDRGADIAVVN